MIENKANLTILKDSLKDSELAILVESIRSITSSLELDEVLEKIMDSALKVIPAADTGYLLLYDNEKDRLIPKAPIGFNDNIYKFQVRVGESITGKVFEDGIGRIYQSQEELFGEMRRNGISEENFHYITTATIFPNAAIAVPIAIEGKRIGVMIIHQQRRKKKFDEHDLLLLQGFAEQAAIAIQNAQYYAEANKRISEITQLSKQLEDRNTQLQKRYEVHERLTNLSLENKGTETIIKQFNHMVDPPVYFYNVIEDMFYLPQPSSISDFTNYELKKLFAAKRKPTYVEKALPSPNKYYLYPIYSGNVFLGCFIIPIAEAISEADRMTLEQGSSILALELIKKQTFTEYFYKRAQEQFQELLSHRDEEQLNRLGNEMGLDIKLNWCITIIEIPSYNDWQQLEIEIHQLVLKIKKELKSRKMMIFGVQNRIVILFSIKDSKHFEAIQKQFEMIRKEWVSREDPPFLGGTSSIYKGLRNIRKCYDEASDTIRFLAARNRFEIMTYERIGLNRLFLHQQPHRIEQFINEVFSPLQGDDDSNKMLEKTLLEYMKTNRSAKNTAKNLHIHTNTLYQRLNKIEDLLQLDFNNNEDILKIQLACYLKSS